MYYDHVTITALRVMDVYRLAIHVQKVDDVEGVVYEHYGPSWVQAHPAILQDVLEAIAEDVYNWAPLTRKADDAESPALPSGGPSTVDQTANDEAR